MSKVVIIDYGAGNVRSVQFALERLGIQAEYTYDIERIISADKVIFPGVGEASSAMKELKKYKLDKLIPTLKQPVLGVCLGMQIMCNHSEENQTDGLNIFPANVLKFNESLKVPHMGWNTIYDLKGNLFKNINVNSYVYYVHSYYVPKNNYSIAITDYEIPFSGGLQKDNFYACQFHPEKSGVIGEQIIKNFMTLS